jgi:hypothetical protein
MKGRCPFNFRHQLQSFGLKWWLSPGVDDQTV